MPLTHAITDALATLEELRRQAVEEESPALACIEGAQECLRRGYEQADQREAASIRAAAEKAERAGDWPEAMRQLELLDRLVRVRRANAAATK